MKKVYQLTKDGKAELENELNALKGRRSAVADKIANARDFGDLSENAEYDAAREEQAGDESRISEIEEILRNAEVIGAKRGSSITLGTKVTLTSGKKTFEYIVVGPVEADPLNGKISNESPLGVALLGKKAGDTAEITTPKGTTKYEISSLN
jgi:transcription elongation factor GreA